MLRRPQPALLGLVSLTGLACVRDAAPGDIRTFAHYQVFVEATDQPDLNTARPQRLLLFHFNANNVMSAAECASFGNATATFSGQPVAIPSPGGWVTNRVPTNTAPGQSVNGDSCYQPFIEIVFNDPRGEPQNGTLEVEGAAGVHLEVPFHHGFGSPELALISSASDRIVVGLKNFLVVPTIAEVTVTLIDLLTSTPPLAVEKTRLGADGTLELSLPAAAISRPVSASLLVTVSLGDDELQCVGFMRCSARSRFIRRLAVDIPFP